MGAPLILEKNTKTFITGKPRDPIKLFPFRENSNFYVYQHIDLYIKRTNGIWEQNSLLLLSFESHIDRYQSQQYHDGLWVLNLSGIENKTFTGHSTKAAPSSIAKSVVVPIRKVLNLGFWSKELIFEKLYHKEIAPDYPNFQICVRNLWKQDISTMVFTFMLDEAPNQF